MTIQVCMREPQFIHSYQNGRVQCHLSLKYTLRRGDSRGELRRFPP